MNNSVFRPSIYHVITRLLWLFSVPQFTQPRDISGQIMAWRSSALHARGGNDIRVSLVVLHLCMSLVVFYFGCSIQAVPFLLCLSFCSFSFSSSFFISMRCCLSSSSSSLSPFCRASSLVPQEQCKYSVLPCPWLFSICVGSFCLPSSGCLSILSLYVSVPISVRSVCSYPLPPFSCPLPVFVHYWSVEPERAVEECPRCEKRESHFLDCSKRLTHTHTHTD